MGREGSFAVFGSDSSSVLTRCAGLESGERQKKYLHIRLQPVSPLVVQASGILLTSSGDCFGPFCAACAYDMLVVCCYLKLKSKDCPLLEN